MPGVLRSAAVIVAVMLPRSALALLATTALLVVLAGCASASVQAQSNGGRSDSSSAEASLAPNVQAQLAYVRAHWKHYNTAEYETLGENDCVNFASQSLVARGWQQTEAWGYGADGVEASTPSWRSSTAMADWLGLHPELAVQLDDSQRAHVKAGDLVQFDWDDSGDRDHTGVVTRIVQAASGIQIYFAGHTDDSEYRSVHEAIHVDHPGARVYYWSLAG